MEEVLGNEYLIDSNPDYSHPRTGVLMPKRLIYCFAFSAKLLAPFLTTLVRLMMKPVRKLYNYFTLVARVYKNG